MLDHVFYIYCRFKGNHAGRYYTNNKNYLLEVRVGRFNGRVKIYNIHGYEHKRWEGSEVHYPTRADFEKSWKVIRDVTEDPGMKSGGNGV